MNTWAFSDEAESCDFQLRILKKRTGLGSHPSSPKTIVLQAILEHVRSSEGGPWIGYDFGEKQSGG